MLMGRKKLLSLENNFLQGEVVTHFPVLRFSGFLFKEQNWGER